jgi:hypothetical protein
MTSELLNFLSVETQIKYLWFFQDCIIDGNPKPYREISFEVALEENNLFLTDRRKLLGKHLICLFYRPVTEKDIDYVVNLGKRTNRCVHIYYYYNCSLYMYIN